MRNFYVTGSIFLMLLFMACQNHKKEESTIDKLQFSEIKLKYAKGFKIFTSDKFTKLIVENPWQKAQNISFEYLLSTDTASHKNTIQIPIRKVVCLSTTHVAYICAIDKHKSILGLTNPNLVSDEVIKNQILLGTTSDIGNEQALNYETILSLNPDIIFAYGIGAEIQSDYQKFAEWGIPVVIVSEYLEESPLAKTEWVKFFSCFYDKEHTSDSLFNVIETRYMEWANTAKNVEEKPLIMSSLPWKGVWYVPGGESFMANFINDAGGNYLFKNEKARESLNLSVEQVMMEGQQADLWIHTGMANSLSDIVASDDRLAQLPAYKNKLVYNNNKRQNYYGGNDFWESGVMNPHLILKDLIHIFHPQLNTDTNLYYYQKLN